jgi:molybdate transport system permease protein
MADLPKTGKGVAPFLALLLLALLLLPLAALFLSSSPAQLLEGIRHPLVLPALALSAKTSALSLAIMVFTGVPLAWIFARRPSRTTRMLEALVDLPIVLPPAVVGIALLLAFGKKGLFGPWLEAMGLSVAFNTGAVVLAQVVVAAPFFVQSATSAFRRVDEDLLVVARTLGASPARAFFKVAIPVALPGLLGGATLAWARAIGEFGATLLFAGNLKGITQTMPLAIYTTLESDVGAAVAIALLLAVAAICVLLAIRLFPRLSQPKIFPRG